MEGEFFAAVTPENFLSLTGRTFEWTAPQYLPAHLHFVGERFFAVQGLTLSTRHFERIGDKSALTHFSLPSGGMIRHCFSGVEEGEKKEGAVCKETFERGHPETFLKEEKNGVFLDKTTFKYICQARRGAVYFGK